MNKFIMSLVFLLCTLIVSASNFTASQTEEIKQMLLQTVTNNGGTCNYILFGQNQAHAETYQHYTTFATNTTVLSDFTFINSNGSLATDTFIGQYNSKMYEFYSYGRSRLKPPYFEYSGANKRLRKYGPASPNGNETLIVHIYCPGISSSSIQIDRDGYGGPVGDQCQRNDHLGYLEVGLPNKLFLPIGPVEITEVK